MSSITPLSDPASSPAHEARIASCIHCGFCLESCPTYLETGREEESPRGRLLLAHGLATGRWEARTILGPLDRCLGCRACEEACPSGVPYGRILEDVRAAIDPHRLRPRNRGERFLVRHLLGYPSRLALLVAAYRRLHLAPAAQWLARRPPIPEPWRRRLRLAPEAETPSPIKVNKTNGESPVTLLRGCVARALFPQTEAAMIRLLEAAGYSVVLADRPACCGALAQHLGDLPQARRWGREFLTHIPPQGVIIPTAAGCGAHLKSIGHQFEEGTQAVQATAAGARVQDLTEALLQGPHPLTFHPRPREVVYQDACHLRHGQGIVDAPRELLRATGAVIHEVPEAELCCGSAGTYNLAEEDMAVRLGRRKARVLRESKVSVVVTANPGCAIQLRAHLQEPGDPEVVTLASHLASFL